MRHCNKYRNRSGAIVVLAAVMLVVVIGFLALAVDLGYMNLARTELQRAADSAALAAAGELLSSRYNTPLIPPATVQDQARAAARTYASSNLVAGDASELDDTDITFGRLDLSTDGSALLQSNYPDQSRFNAVRVRIRKTSEQNGEISLFFAQALGFSSASSRAVATAVYADNFRGFRPPAEGEPNLPILPIALDKQTWDEVLAGRTGDSWTWNESTHRIIPGQDGVPEASLYPQGTGSPGNRGTVDIGSSNNSTRDLSRQIRDGIRAADLAQLPGGTLELGANGTTSLNGDTGISAGIKDDLAAIVGQTRIIPIFSSVTGNGNNAQYTIVQFAGVRLMAVNLTGNLANRYVIIQPARMMIDNGIPGSDDSQFSLFLFSKSVWLVE